MKFRRKSKNENERRNESLEEVFDDHQLPTFPAAVSEALALLGDEDVVLADAAAVLESDPGLSVQVLSAVNSAAVGLARRVENVTQAVTLLGRNEVESIVVGSAAKAAIPPPTSPVFDQQRFWQTATSRAVVAATIEGVTNPRRRSEAFTAALLQDMALPVLVERVPGYEDLLGCWYAGEVAHLAPAEAGLLGWDHAEAAASMGRRWNFPPALLDAIACHHQQEESADLVGPWLVADWHEVDADVGPQSLAARAPSVPALAGHDCAALVAEALDGAGAGSST